MQSTSSRRKQSDKICREVTTENAEPGKWYHHDKWGKVLCCGWYHHDKWGKVLCCGTTGGDWIPAFAIRLDTGRTVMKYLYYDRLVLSPIQSWHDGDVDEAADRSSDKICRCNSRIMLPVGDGHWCPHMESPDQRCAIALRMAWENINDLPDYLRKYRVKPIYDWENDPLPSATIRDADNCVQRKLFWLDPATGECEQMVTSNDGSEVRVHRTLKTPVTISFESSPCGPKTT